MISGFLYKQNYCISLSFCDLNLLIPKQRSRDKANSLGQISSSSLILVERLRLVQSSINWHSSLLFDNICLKLILVLALAQINPFDGGSLILGQNKRHTVSQYV